MLLCGLAAAVATGTLALSFTGTVTTPRRGDRPTPNPKPDDGVTFRGRMPLDTSGFGAVASKVPPWSESSSLQEIAGLWRDVGHRLLRPLDDYLAGSPELSEAQRLNLRLARAMLLNYEGEPAQAYDELTAVRASLEGNSLLSAGWLYTVIYYQGVCSLRRGENENCIMCRGESSCILPIAPAAVHRNPRGSRAAVAHFTEYLRRFPDDLEVRWLLNLAHMTLGEHPGKVDPAYVLTLDRWTESEFDIGRFHDVGHQAGVNQYNQAGGAVMEDFDNDGLLDLAVTSFDPTQRMTLYRNAGDGTFEDRTESAGVAGQLGGLFCVQGDYDNDGSMDLYIPRGAWLTSPIRPTLLRNNGGGGFVDVTEAAGLLDPVNSNSASWADYDNDGFLDLFVCCEQQPNRLYHNRRDGTFEEVASRARLHWNGQPFCKGAAWLDYDNDRDPDLFVNYLNGPAHLFRNNGDGTFTEVTSELGINGPQQGFSCWAWDYDNDGWLDIFATCYDRTVDDVVKGLLGRPHGRLSNRLFRNVNGRGFENATKAAGLDMVFASMGSNFADFDNDGYLDMYLATGEPSLGSLVPNRLFKNVAGKRFAEVTASSGTGHLQKGHGVACGDWDRDGDVDLFVQTGGAVNGDKYHNVLFENPGQGNHWLTVKLVGKKSNRAAVGARIKAVTAGPAPLTVHRHVTSGSSFGANPLQQTLGLAQADRVTTLEVYWPTSDTTQVFHDIAADQAIEVTEFAEGYHPLGWRALPKAP
jgi:hypothetical protein